MGAALCACTANGAFQPARLDGGGIPPAPTSAYEQMYRKPHTGIIYTPPDASDHVAVSLSLICPLQRTLVLRNDAPTKYAQPQKKQMSLTGFFKRKVSGIGGENPHKKQHVEQQIEA